MKFTRRNGRARKNGAYNPKHNDRRFNIENSEHIDVDRSMQNVYWDCYTGLSSALTREQDNEHDYSFEKIEHIYYYEHYADHIRAQNERNEKPRHTERNRTVDDLLTNNKTCQEESVYQIGTVDEVAEQAYEKTCEIVTDNVRQETQKYNIKILADYSNWLSAPERTDDKKLRNHTIRRLETLKEKFLKSAKESREKVTKSLQAGKDRQSL